VKYGESNPVPIATERCDFVDQFKEAIKQKMKPDLDSFSPSRITLHISEDADALDSEDELCSVVGKILSYYGLSSVDQLDMQHALIVKTIQPQGGKSEP
jgi:hypothetical protein